MTTFQSKHSLKLHFGSTFNAMMLDTRLDAIWIRLTRPHLSYDTTVPKATLGVWLDPEM